MGGLPADCPLSRPILQDLTCEVADLAQPRHHSVVTGGGLDLSNCTSIQANGHVFPRPDFSLFLGQNPQERTLDIRVEGSCDTVLVVKDGWTSPTYFSDDADGSYHPPIRIPAAHDGLYPIGIGTFGPNTCSATLIIAMN